MRALLLDFNGTISDDEPLLCRIFMELFADEKPLNEDEYYERLAGLADREIVQVWLGRDDPALVQRKIELAAIMTRGLEDEWPKDLVEWEVNLGLRYALDLRGREDCGHG